MINSEFSSLEKGNTTWKEAASELHGLSLISEDDRIILSIGISAGDIEIKMAQANPKCKIIATTINNNGIELTRKRVDEAGVSDQVDLKVEDIKDKMPYDDNYFDFIYARLVLHYLNKYELAESLKEIYRVLKPGGKFFVVVRSVDEWELKQDEVTYDESTGMTTYPIRYEDHGAIEVMVARQFFTIESISKYLKEARFKVIHAEENLEQCYHDYERTRPVRYPNLLIEVVATKRG